MHSRHLRIGKLLDIKMQIFQKVQLGVGYIDISRPNLF